MYPAGIYLLKVNNRNTRTTCEICSKLAIETKNPYEIMKNNYFKKNWLLSASMYSLWNGS